ncbi:MAG: hypothetical protein VYB30_05370 [Candidatus Thermoplasmatota archaeon]|nr:hypothetical protein [Candidatus Thermoplasmatota archaeon]
MSDIGGGIGLPTMSQREMFEQLLGDDESRSASEPEIAAAIGEQMIHMDLRPLPRSIRKRIRDIAGRIPARNVVIVGGGIGHLTAWMMDLWCGNPAHEESDGSNRPDTLRVIEEGGKFGVIIDRLLRRYDASGWAQVISVPWGEIAAETESWNAANATLPDVARNAPLPQPIDLVIIDLPELERAQAVTLAFNLLAPGGIVMALEPQVPTGDVGEPEQEAEMTPAQQVVASFNQWIEFVQSVNSAHSAAFVELAGGTLGVFLRSA